MNYTNEMLLRADIQQIREFILHGTEEQHIDHRSYEVRTEHTLMHLLSELQKVYPDSDGYEKISDLVYECIGAFEDVYTEIGLQAGAIVATQIFQNSKASFDEN